MARFKYSVFWYSFLFGISVSVSKPNIVVIIADDLGWNDVGFHGSNEIPTPNIDALAYNGIILNRHYVLPTCTPSRAALMTGKYPIRTGLQGDPGRPEEPWALPLKEKILPQYLKDYGYKIHLVGKWHLGFFNTAYTPTKRGFDTHFGYYNGWIRYNDSVCASTFDGIDARRNLKPAGDEFAGQYATDVFTKEAVNIIRNHDSKTALFLELSHVAPHAIRNDTLQVRDENKNDADFEYIVDVERRRLAGVLQALDESVGKIVEALKEANLLDNSVVLFISDNGGSTEDKIWHFRNSASNWPLRGMKTSVHEGGVRGAAAIWSPLFARKNYVSDELFHISDWLPTFVSAAGGDSKLIRNIDGINQWNVLIGNQLKTERREVLVNVNYERNTSAIIQENWKLIKNTETYQPSYNDYYAGVTGRTENPPYALDLVLNSTTNHLIGNKQEKTTGSKFLTIRSQAKLDSKCQSRISQTPNFDDIKCLGFCLFDLEIDPCESSNIAELHSDIVTKLNTRLQYYESITEPQQRPKDDANANPDRWGGYWSPWTDESDYSSSSTIAYDLLVFGIVFVICKKIISRT